MLTPRGFVRAPGLARVLLLAATLASCPAVAQIPPPASDAGKKPNPWNSSTMPRPPPTPPEQGALSLRIYSETDARNLPPYTPGHGRRDDPGYAVDVSAVMTRCADGSLLITALVIGGQLTPLDNRCRGEPARNPPVTAPACDARRWNCATTGAEPAN